MSDTDLSSMGFTSFGKTPKHHQTAPIHANPTPLPSSLPPRPSSSSEQGQQGHYNQYNQGQFHRGRGGGGGGGGRGGGNYRGNFDNRGGGRGGRGGGGGPHRRGFHSNSQYQRGGSRGGRHHHPYPNRQNYGNRDNNNQGDHHQEREFSTSNTPAYRSKDFGEGLYKPSMNEDPWAVLIKNKQPQGGVSTAVGAGDIWMGQEAAGDEHGDKSTWYDKPEDKAADGGGWNADEIDLGDD